MPGQTAVARNSNSRTLSGVSSWPQYLLLFALIFAALMLPHAPLLRLPYFWDEAGYYIPAAHDLYIDGTLIPHSTVSNAHPPLVMAWLALAWRLAGVSPLVTRTAMLAVASFALLGLFRLARVAANVEVAIATTMLVAVYPVFFSQSSLAHLDVAAAGLTFWGLLAWVEDRPIGQAVWFSFAALTKETAILAPAALFGWEIVARVARAFLPAREQLDSVAQAFLPASSVRKSHPAILLVPLLPLASWYGFHYAKTGYLLGNPEFYRYNVAATVDAGRIPFALAIRVWQVFGYFGLYLLTLVGLLAMTRKPGELKEERRTFALPWKSGPSGPRQLSRISAGFSPVGSSGSASGMMRPRIPIWIQGAFFSVAVAYVLFMSVIGGAALARYMLPVVPLIMMVLTSTLWRRVRYWAGIVAVIAIVFVTGLFHNPPYGYSLEDNLAYRDFIVLHTEATHFLEMQFPHPRVLTAWPASDELNRPWLGYVSHQFPIVRIEDFRATEIARAADLRNQFDVALVFSTKYEPEHPILENLGWWRHIKERYFGYHSDLKPDEIARQLGGQLLFRKQANGQWIGIIELKREK